MRKIRSVALLIILTMLMSISVVGCKNKKEQSSATESDRRAEIVVKDFCTFLSSGKLDRVEKLVDGNCTGIEKLRNYQNSDAASLLKQVGAYTSFEIQDVNLKRTSGEAEVCFTTVDHEEVMARITKESTAKEIKQIISEVSQEEITVTLELVKTEKSWAITPESANQTIEALYGFIDQTDVETTPKITPSPEPTVLELTVDYSYWLNEYFNQVDGYRQRETFVLLFIAVNNEFYDQRFYFQYTTPEGAVLYEGQYYVTNGNNYIECLWETASLYGLDTLCCDIYDDDNHKIYSTSVHIFGENEEAPVPIDCIYAQLVNEKGEVVPGFYEGDMYVGVKVQLAYMVEDGSTSLHYSLSPIDESGEIQIIAEADIDVNGYEMTLPLSDLPALQSGQYIFEITSKEGTILEFLFFQVIPEGETFSYSTGSASYVDRYWTTEMDVKEHCQRVSSSYETIYYVFLLDSVYDYVGFTYTLTDEAGELIEEGKAEVIWYDRCLITVNLNKVAKGDLTIEVYNSDGTHLLTDAVEVI